MITRPSSRQPAASGQNILERLLQGNQAPAPLQQTYGIKPTVQQKMIRTNKRFGNPGIEKQQGSTYAIYDALPLDGRTSFRFFENVRTRAFPFTNIGENKLQVAESLAIEYMSLAIVVATAVSVVPIVSVNDIQTAALTSLYRSDLSIFLDNNRVLKPIPVGLMQSKFNPHATFLGNDILRFESDVIIPPLIQFVSQLDTTFATVTANTFLMMTLGGAAGIFAPREVY
jgi:hypothetical protein